MNNCFRIVVLIGLVYVGGCASTVVPPGPQPLSEYHRKQLGKVLVTPSYESDEITSGINPGKGVGISKGAGGASAAWVGGALQSGDPLTASVGILLTPLAGLAGGVYGAVVADRAEDVERHVATMEAVLAETESLYEVQLQQQLEALPYLPTIVSNDTTLPHGSRLEVHFRELHGKGDGPKSDMRFTLYTDTRLYMGEDSYPLFERTYLQSSPVKRLSAWAADDGAVLRRGIEDMVLMTVENVLEDYFLESSYWANPLYPAKQYLFKAPRLDSAKPQFRWQLLEGRHLVTGSDNESLRYEVQVLDKVGIVRQKADISGNTFQFADALAECGSYSWQVRANYEAFGQPRSSAWSRLKAFRTPCTK